MKFIDDEQLIEVSGGYNVDDLTPEELDELEKYGGMLIEMQIMMKNGDPGFSREKYLELIDKLNELDKAYRKKYGA